MAQTAVIFGATGLVGSACLELMLSDKRYGRVIAIGRRAPARADAKLVVRRATLDSAEALDDPTLGSVDNVYCCLGTTIAKARVPVSFPARRLRLCREQCPLRQASGRSASSSHIMDELFARVQERVTVAGDAASLLGRVAWSCVKEP